MTRSATLLTLFTTFLLISSNTLGQARYISDELLVPVRKGQGTQYAIIHKGLPSGTQVTLIKSDKASGWSQIRSPKGLTGWVPTRYLVRTPTAKVLLSSNTAELEKIKQQHNDLKLAHEKTQAQLKETQQALSSETSRADNALKDLTKLKEISSNAIQNSRRLDELILEKNNIEIEATGLTRKLERAKSSSRTEFFLYGVFAVLLGVVLAILLPRLQRQKRYSEWG